MHPFLDCDGPIAMAHRGFSREGLENSMLAFGAAIDLGFRYLETDAHASSDGVAVAFHDTRLDRVTDGLGEVAAQPWSRLQRALIGGREPVPALEDLLGSWPQVRVNIDVKSAAAIGPVVAAVRRTASAHRVCIASFSDRRRAAVLAALGEPAPARSAGTCAASAAVLYSLLPPGLCRMWPRSAGSGSASVDCLQLPESVGALPVVTGRLLRAAHSRGLQVHVWTVNEAPRMHRLLDLGVDGLITDRADTLRDVLRARRQWQG